MTRFCESRHSKVSMVYIAWLYMECQCNVSYMKVNLHLSYIVFMIIIHKIWHIICRTIGVFREAESAPKIDTDIYGVPAVRFCFTFTFMCVPRIYYFGYHIFKDPLPIRVDWFFPLKKAECLRNLFPPLSISKPNIIFYEPALVHKPLEFDIILSSCLL